MAKQADVKPDTVWSCRISGNIVPVRVIRCVEMRASSFYKATPRDRFDIVNLKTGRDNRVTAAKLRKYICTWQEWEGRIQAKAIEDRLKAMEAAKNQPPPPPKAKYHINVSFDIEATEDVARKVASNIEELIGRASGELDSVLITNLDTDEDVEDENPFHVAVKTIANDGLLYRAPETFDWVAKCAAIYYVLMVAAKYDASLTIETIAEEIAAKFTLTKMYIEEPHIGQALREMMHMVEQVPGGRWRIWKD